MDRKSFGWAMALAAATSAAIVQTARATVLYYDDFSLNGTTRTAGADLNGAPVLLSALGPQNWSSNSLYIGGSFTFADNAGTGYIHPNDYHSSNLATLPLQLGTGIYEIKAQLFPEFPLSTDTPLDNRHYLGIGFYKQNSGGYLWQSEISALTLEIGIDKQYTVHTSGMYTTPASGTIASWDGLSPVSVAMRWDTKANTASVWLETTTMPQTQVMNNVALGVSPSSVQFVGFGRDDWLGPNSSVNLFSLIGKVAPTAPQGLHVQGHVEVPLGDGPSVNVPILSAVSAGSADATFAHTDGGQLSVKYAIDTLAQFAADPDAAGAPTPSFQLPADGSVVQFWDVTFTDGTFNGPVQLVLHYDPTGMTLDQEQHLVPWHYVGGDWVQLAGTVDTTSNTITLTTDSFSPFALGTVPEPVSLGIFAIGGWALLRRRQGAPRSELD